MIERVEGTTRRRSTGSARLAVGALLSTLLLAVAYGVWLRAVDLSLVVPLLLLGAMTAAVITGIALRQWPSVDIGNPALVMSVLFLLFFVAKPIDTVLFGATLYRSSSLSPVGDGVRYAVAGYASFLAGYSLFGRWATTSAPPQDWTSEILNVRILAASLLAVGVVSSVSLVLFLRSVGGPLAYFGRLALASGMLSGERRWFGLLANMFPSVLLVWLANRVGITGRVGALPGLVVMLASLPFLIFNPGNARQNFVTILFSVALLSYYAPGRPRYRRAAAPGLRVLAWGLGITILSALMLVFATWYRSLRMGVPLQVVAQEVGLVHSALDPFKTTDAYFRLVSMVPSSVPYVGPQAYLESLFAFVPRLIWPGKPLNYGFGQFTRIFYGTNAYVVSATILGELFWAGGVVMVVVGTAGLGVWVSYLFRILRPKRSTWRPGRAALYATIPFGYLLNTVRGGIVAGFLYWMEFAIPIIVVSTVASSRPKIIVRLSLAVLYAAILVVSVALIGNNFF